MGSTFTNILLHAVFSTKHRQEMISPDLQDRLYAYMGGVMRDKGGVLYSAGGVADHVHLLFRWHATGKIADLISQVKGGSSGWVHETFPAHADFKWQDGYAVFSVSQSQARKVERYIQNQAEHHKRVSFQDELRALLRAHEIDYDERYIWR